MCLFSMDALPWLRLQIMIMLKLLNYCWRLEPKSFTETMSIFSEFSCRLSFSINLFVCTVNYFTFVNVFVVRKERLLWCLLLKKTMSKCFKYCWIMELMLMTRMRLVSLFGALFIDLYFVLSEWMDCINVCCNVWLCCKCWNVVECWSRCESPRQLCVLTCWYFWRNCQHSDDCWWFVTDDLWLMILCIF